MTDVLDPPEEKPEAPEPALDPFATFDEWDSDADRRAYGDF